jgi:phosphoribosylanthranilate isomerase
MSLIVKICGLATPETLEVALDAGADMVGFVFFPPSPRHLGLEIARGLGQQVKRRAMKVALTVDADDATLGAIIEALQPDLLQLHGRETVARLGDIKQKFGLDVMKVIAVETAADLASLPGYAAIADRILFDARAPKEATRPGGLGAVFDWHVLENLDLRLPFMVSGGLNAGNVREAVRVTRAGGVDVSSGVERAPGVKDPAMIRDFIRAARATDLTSPLPVYGERHRPPSAAVLEEKNAEAERRLCRSCDPGEGASPHSRLSPNSRKGPLTPTLSPQERGEGAEAASRCGEKS